jgi:hypothetical protein
MANPVNSQQHSIAREAAALYDLQLGETTMGAALAAVGQMGSVDALVNQVYNADFAGLSNADAAALIVKNVGITTASGLSAGDVSDAVAAMQQALDAAPAGQKGAATMAALNGFACGATYGAAFLHHQITELRVTRADGTPDILVHLPSRFIASPATPRIAGASAMRMTRQQTSGTSATRYRLAWTSTVTASSTRTAIRLSEANNAVVGAHHSGFAVVDAYSRNPLNINDVATTSPARSITTAPASSVTASPPTATSSSVAWQKTPRSVASATTSSPAATAVA